MAASYVYGIAKNHGFVDGNKRTAFAATFTFLAINGIDLTAGADETWTFLSRLYDRHEFAFTALDAWLREHTRPMT